MREIEGAARIVGEILGVVMLLICLAFFVGGIALLVALVFG